MPSHAAAARTRSLTADEAQARAALLTVASYDVTLDLTTAEDAFDSRTRIRFRSGGGETILDLKATTVRSAVLDGRPVSLDRWEDGRLRLPRTEGEHELVVDAVMPFRRDGEGLHRAVDPADGRHYVYGMSFMDAAPSIFACFDQPDLKAPYTLHVTAPQDWVVIGNGRAEQVEPGRWELATTPPLSTYFVTLVAGPYHQILDEHDGIRLGLAARASLARHLEEQADDLLTVTRQCFDEFHRLFGVRYAFGDYHQAFVPEFNAGAMENPGCVTFRDPMIFTSRVTRYERVNRASTIAHEMAHQWFGDLVSPRWWDDLWLNESFAEMMGTRVTRDATQYDDVRVTDAFRRKAWGLFADQGPSTHPVAGNGAADALSALQDFDGISYAKGAATLRQLNAMLGDEVFLGGVRDHFARHRFGNADMHDLFASWQRAGADDLTDWVEGWLRTPGLDTIALDRDHQVVRRTPPERYPADRRHRFDLAVYDEGAWRRTPVTVAAAETPADVGDAPVLPDPGEATWARFDLDPTTREALPRLLPDIADPLMRAATWNAIRNGVHNGVLCLDEALRLVEVGLPLETDDTGVQQIGAFALTRAVGWSREPEAALSAVHGAALRGLAAAAPGSGRQLALFQVAAASCPDARILRGWLGGTDTPHGLAVDRELTWRILTRLATLGETDEEELRARFDGAPDAESAVDHARARASLPEPQAKAWAWERFTGAASASNYEVTAIGDGFWRRGQGQVTGQYVERYFAEVPALAGHFRGWVLPDVAEAFFPRWSFDTAVTETARIVVEQPDLDASVRRRVTECLDLLERAVVARSR